MFILVSMTTPLEFITGEIEDVPCMVDIVNRCDLILLNVVVGVDKR